MRLLFWGLLFLLLLCGSAAGVASSFSDLALAAAFALLFLVSLVRLLVTSPGLSTPFRPVRRPGDTRPTGIDPAEGGLKEQLGEGHRRLLQPARNQVRLRAPGQEQVGVQEDRPARLLPA